MGEQNNIKQDVKFKTKHRRWTAAYLIIAVMLFCNALGCIAMIQWVAYDYSGYVNQVNRSFDRIFSDQFDWMRILMFFTVLSIILIVFCIFKARKHYKIYNAEENN